MQDTVQGTSTQETAQGTSTQKALAYEIKGRTMSIEEWDLTIQIERLRVRWISHPCHITAATSKSTMSHMTS